MPDTREVRIETSHSVTRISCKECEGVEYALTQVKTVTPVGEETHYEVDLECIGWGHEAHAEHEVLRVAVRDAMRDLSGDDPRSRFGWPRCPTCGQLPIGHGADSPMDGIRCECMDMIYRSKESWIERCQTYAEDLWTERVDTNDAPASEGCGFRVRHVPSDTQKMVADPDRSFAENRHDALRALWHSDEYGAWREAREKNDDD